MKAEPLNNGREAWVKVSPLEMVLGAEVGIHRAVEVITGNRKNRAGGLDSDGNIWTREVEGAIAELAVAGALNVFWGGAGHEDKLTGPKATGGDVGDLQVRLAIASAYDNAKHLIVQQPDDPAETFVLVVGRAPTYRVAGWIVARDAKSRPDWIKNYGGYGEAWFVPQDGLRHLRDLPRP